MGLRAHGDPGYGQGLDMLHHPNVPEDKAYCRHHEDTMHLNVIKPVDVPHGRFWYHKDYTQALVTDDIEGARPRYPHRELYRNGPPKKADIPGSSPRKLYPELNKARDTSLTTGDLERAQPNVIKFKTSRVVDPNTPRYELPSVQINPPEVPKPLFHEGRVRDSMEFKGEWTPRIQNRNYVRDPNEHRDIEFTQPNLTTRTKRTTAREFWTIEQAGSRILSSRNVSTPRSTDPLDPVYTTAQQTTHPFRRGDVDVQQAEAVRRQPNEGAPVAEDNPFAPRRTGFIPGSTPRVLHRDNGEPQASLIRSDIAGAVPQRYKGAMPINIYDPHEVTPYLGHLGLDCSDIPGAQPGTRTPGTH